VINAKEVVIAIDVKLRDQEQIPKFKEFLLALSQNIPGKKLKEIDIIKKRNGGNLITMTLRQIEK